MNKIRLYSIFAVAVSLLFLGAAYAATSTSTSVTITGGTPVGVTAWAPNNTPSWSPAASSGGTITAGNLYNVTVADGDIALVTVYLTNPSALQLDYNFLSMNISYVAGTTSKVTTSTLFAGNLLSLSSGYVQFEIDNSGGALSSSQNKATIGIFGVSSFYCISTTAAGGSLSPSFYVTVQAL